MKTNLLDLVSPEEREEIQALYKKRKSGNTSYRGKLTIPPDIFLIAEAGYYFGWGAVEAAKRGYVEGFETITKDGKMIQKRTKIPLMMEELNILVEGARKVKYSAVVDAARGTQAGVASSLSKHPDKVFKEAVKPYSEGAKP